MKQILTFFVLIYSYQSSWAIELDYPELHVEPNASSRVYDGAKEEAKKSFRHYTPLYLSGLTTLAAGVNQFNVLEPDQKTGKEDKNSAYVATGVGLLTISAAAYLQFSYHPYLSSYSKIRNMKTKNKRLRLRKERLAEEAIERAHKLYTKVKWMAFATQFGSGLFMNSEAKDGEKLGAQLTMAFSFLPLLFDHFWSDNYHNLKRDKKRIYAPLVSSYVNNVRGDQRVGMVFNWFF